MAKDKHKIISEYLRNIARRGGKASARALTPAQRSAKARRAGLAGGRGRPRQEGVQR